MDFKSRLPSVDIPSGVSYPRFLLFNQWRRHPQRKALVDAYTGRSYTYAELWVAVRHLSATLRQRGVSRGDVVCLCSENSAQYLVVMYAVMETGGVVTTMNPAFTQREMLLQMQSSKPRMIFSMKENKDKMQHLLQHALYLPELIFFDGPVNKTNQSFPYKTVSDLMAEKNDGHVDDVTLDPASDVCILPYSSGTTGLPKGVMLTHRNMIASTCLASCPELSVYSSDDTVVVVAPLYHMFAIQVQTGPALYNSATVVIMRGFQMQQYLHNLKTHQASVLHLVPPLVVRLAKRSINGPADDLHSSVRTVVTAGAPLGEGTKLEFKRRYPNIALCDGFGLTEVSGLSHHTPPNSRSLASCGTLSPNMECKVIDTLSLKTLNYNEKGEILLRGPIVMKGYWQNEDATKRAIDSHGWFRTGDIGYCDRDQKLHIVDRVKELIKYNAYQVAPAELEAILLTHPDVEDAAVVGRIDQSAGELPTAFIVPKNGRDVSRQTLINFVQERVSSYKRLRGGVIFVDEIPKSASGKILRRLLRDTLLKPRSKL